MEKQTNRSLAYLLAKTITEEELSDISGGVNPGARSYTVTGDSAHGLDMGWDATFDL